MAQEEIYVIGHMNPDTDSICSAISYARLRERQGLEGVRPARAGNVNRQTEFILNELAVPQPELLLDVSPRIRDVLSRQAPVSIPATAPLARALELFHLHNIRILPVVDEGQHPLGMLFLKKVSERFLVPSQEKELRRVYASPASICQCLKATALHAVEAEALEELNLYVAAMSEPSFVEKIREQDKRRMVLIAGDRLDILRIAVEQGVRVLVVVGGLEVPEEILRLGRENDVTILSTRFDTATSTWLTRLATPVSALAQKDFLCLKLQDRLEQAQASLMHSPVPGAVVLDDNGVLLSVVTKSNLLTRPRRKLILVDHNELSQAVAGAEKVEIVEIIDHHRLGSLQTEKPIRFINQPVGSTCTLVATLYQQASLDPEPAIAGLMLAGLLSDTVVLKSPTTTEIDRQMAVWLGEKSGLDPQEFGQRIFSATSAISAYGSLAEVVTADFKVFQSGATQFGVGQVEVVSFHEFFSLKMDLALELARLREQRKLAMTALLVTDIVAGDSVLLVSARDDLVFVMGYPQLDKGLYELKGVLSRKKQLVPHLIRVLAGA
ncbi:MAG: putative manganese-dependent inorganic diphosphatase [Desulfuromonadaceae bacterium]|nr:putative manganese-dependent inorganic diphosphatase [Desulfuromonadaceae bacterium]